MLFITKAILHLSCVSVLHTQLKLHSCAKQIQLHFIRNVFILWFKVDFLKTFHVTKRGITWVFLVFLWAGYLHAEYESKHWCVTVPAGLPPGRFSSACLKWLVTSSLEFVWIQTDAPRHQPTNGWPVDLTSCTPERQLKMDSGQAENSEVSWGMKSSWFVHILTPQYPVTDLWSGLSNCIR